MRKIAMWLMALCLFASCEKGEDPVPKRKERVDILLSKAEEEVVANNNVFAFNLFREVSKRKSPNENPFISPLSANVAFSMLLNGADGTTKEEIEEVLGYKGMSMDEINDFYLKILEAAVDIDPQVNVSMANSIWLKNGFTPLASFINTNSTYYDAEVRNVDFSQPQTLSTINNWISQKTGGRINQMLSRLNPRDVLYIINALYFKGEWAKPFTESDTKEELFYNQDGTKKSVPMMFKSANALYAQNEEYALTSLPYGNGAFQMVLLLPNEEVEISTIIANLTDDSWQECLSLYGGRCTVKLKLPRFKIDYDIELNEILKEMGMETAFDTASADFSKLSDTPVAISLVRQKAQIEVNEEGTVAVATTVVGMTETAAIPRPDDIKEFYIDRPFLYFIREISTGTIFFIGQIDKM